jgi:2-keto-4-pentenoate hydratase/2-oxohepta-3-ene-1,7-dioic acid hydratase in catechol pathway
MDYVFQHPASPGVEFDMKLLRFGPSGQEQPGILDSAGRIRSLANILDDIAGESLSPASLARLRELDLDSLPLVGSPSRGGQEPQADAARLAAPTGQPPVRVGPCVGRVGKFIAIGLNYSEHAAETNAKIPNEPVVFMKATSCINGPYDDIVIPRGSRKTDWEVELGVIIGTKAKYVSEADALRYVAGYCVVHDVSEREFQIERGGTWDKGKGCDSFGPIGPWLVTTDDVPDPQNLALWLEVDGKRCQNGSTRTMIFSVRNLVSYLSQFMSLHPGDIITTGTPAGVGMGAAQRRRSGRTAAAYRGGRMRRGWGGEPQRNRAVFGIA